MNELRTSYCKRCKAMIVFIPTGNDKYMPCDPNPVMYREDKFEKAVIYTREGKYVRCTLSCTAENYTGWGYKPHWGTCVSDDSRRRYEARQQPERTPPRTVTEKKPEPRPKPVIEESKFEQLCLFGNGERRDRHPW